MFSCYKATAPGEKKVQSPLQNGECCKKKKKKKDFVEWGGALS